MKYRIMRQAKVDNTEAIKQEVGRFESLNDALWTATLFTAHKTFSASYIYFVEKGKKSWVPCTALDPTAFNLLEKR